MVTFSQSSTKRPLRVSGIGMRIEGRWAKVSSWWCISVAMGFGRGFGDTDEWRGFEMRRGWADSFCNRRLEQTAQSAFPPLAQTPNQRTFSISQSLALFVPLVGACTLELLSSLPLNPPPNSLPAPLFFFWAPPPPPPRLAFFVTSFASRSSRCFWRRSAKRDFANSLFSSFSLRRRSASTQSSQLFAEDSLISWGFGGVDGEESWK